MEFNQPHGSITYALNVSHKVRTLCIVMSVWIAIEVNTHDVCNKSCEATPKQETHIRKQTSHTIVTYSTIRLGYAMFVWVSLLHQPPHLPGSQPFNLSATSVTAIYIYIYMFSSVSVCCGPFILLPITVGLSLLANCCGAFAII